MARLGLAVHLFGLGLRRFEVGSHWRSFVRQLELGLVEERAVGLWNLFDWLRRRRSGLPPLGAADWLERHASETLCEALDQAQVVQCESPWLFDFTRRGHNRVLVAHNVEAALLEANPRIRERDRRRAALLEGRAWNQAEVVICLTDADRAELERRYGARPAVVLPLGVDTQRFRPATRDLRDEARTRLGLDDRFVVLFAGSWHAPNRDALARIEAWADEAPEGLLFAVAGSVADRPLRKRNLVVTGPLPDLDDWFTAADAAIHPVEDGSGANVKLLEYLASGLPTVSTRFGARGVEVVNGEHLILCEPAGFPAALQNLRRDHLLRDALARNGRHLMITRRSWAVIAEQRQRLYDGFFLRGLGRSAPEP
jgi:glycosyltransferase involved in cell wall biosynthesis